MEFDFFWSWKVMKSHGIWTSKKSMNPVTMLRWPGHDRLVSAVGFWLQCWGGQDMIRWGRLLVSDYNVGVSRTWYVGVGCWFLITMLRWPGHDTLGSAVGFWLQCWGGQDMIRWGRLLVSDYNVEVARTWYVGVGCWFLITLLRWPGHDTLLLAVGFWLQCWGGQDMIRWGRLLVSDYTVEVARTWYVEVGCWFLITLLRWPGHDTLLLAVGFWLQCWGGQDMIRWGWLLVSDYNVEVARTWYFGVGCWFLITMLRWPGHDTLGLAVGFWLQCWGGQDMIRWGRLLVSDYNVEVARTWYVGVGCWFLITMLRWPGHDTLGSAVGFWLQCWGGQDMIRWGRLLASDYNVEVARTWYVGVGCWFLITMLRWPGHDTLRSAVGFWLQCWGGQDIISWGWLLVSDYNVEVARTWYVGVGCWFLITMLRWPGHDTLGLAVGFWLQCWGGQDMIRWGRLLVSDYNVEVARTWYVGVGCWFLITMLRWPGHDTLGLAVGFWLQCWGGQDVIRWGWLLVSDYNVEVARTWYVGVGCWFLITMLRWPGHDTLGLAVGFWLQCWGGQDMIRWGRLLVSDYNVEVARTWYVGVGCWFLITMLRWPGHDTLGSAVGFWLHVEVARTWYVGVGCWFLITMLRWPGHDTLVSAVGFWLQCWGGQDMIRWGRLLVSDHNVEVSRTWYVGVGCWFLITMLRWPGHDTLVSAVGFWLQCWGGQDMIRWGWLLVSDHNVEVARTWYVGDGCWFLITMLRWPGHDTLGSAVGFWSQCWGGQDMIRWGWLLVSDYNVEVETDMIRWGWLLVSDYNVEVARTWYVGVGCWFLITMLRWPGHDTLGLAVGFWLQCWGGQDMIRWGWLLVSDYNVEVARTWYVGVGCWFLITMLRCPGNDTLGLAVGFWLQCWGDQDMIRWGWLLVSDYNVEVARTWYVGVGCWFLITMLRWPGHDTLGLAVGFWLQCWGGQDMIRWGRLLVSDHNVEVSRTWYVGVGCWFLITMLRWPGHDTLVSAVGFWLQCWGGQDMIRWGWLLVSDHNVEVARTWYVGDGCWFLITMLRWPGHDTLGSAVGFWSHCWGGQDMIRWGWLLVSDYNVEVETDMIRWGWLLVSDYNVEVARTWYVGVGCWFLITMLRWPGHDTLGLAVGFWLQCWGGQDMIRWGWLLVSDYNVEVARTWYVGVGCWFLITMLRCPGNDTLGLAVGFWLQCWGDQDMIRWGWLLVSDYNVEVARTWYVGVGCWFLITMLRWPGHDTLGLAVGFWLQCWGGQDMIRWGWLLVSDYNVEVARTWYVGVGCWFLITMLRWPGHDTLGLAVGFWLQCWGGQDMIRQASTISFWSHWPRGPVDLKSYWPEKKLLARKKSLLQILETDVQNYTIHSRTK